MERVRSKGMLFEKTAEKAPEKTKIRPERKWVMIVGNVEYLQQWKCL
jgi:hypothetical protein